MGGKGSGRPKGSPNKSTGDNADNTAGGQNSGNSKGDQAVANSSQQQSKSGQGLTGQSEQINFTKGAKGSQQADSGNKSDKKDKGSSALAKVTKPFDNISKRDKIAIGLVLIASTFGIALMFIFRGKRAKQQDAAENNTGGNEIIRRKSP